MEIKTIDNIQYIVIDNGFVILKGFTFEITKLWYTMVILPIMTFIDFFAHATVGELHLLNDQSEVA